MVGGYTNWTIIYGNKKFYRKHRQEYAKKREAPHMPNILMHIFLSNWYYLSNWY